MHSRTRQIKRKDDAKLAGFFIAVTDELREHPNKLDVVKHNLAVYQSHRYLKAGFLKALERMQWLFEANLTIEEICQQVLADDYIGKRIRRYPLIFKGVIPSAYGEN